MTRDELIARTAQLVDEGVRLQANPSLDALRTWLQLSDDLLSTAWGSMDRYHLSWLQVGRPKSIVRGRPMLVDEAAAYVREVAAAKTAVLRMSLDAAGRLRMPFVGETGGAGATMIQRVRPSAGVRTVPAPDPVARDYLRLVLRLDQHRPGLVDAYFGPADLKAEADMEPLRPPARLADDAVALRERLAAEVVDPGRREWLRAQLVALEAQAREAAGEAVPYEAARRALLRPPDGPRGRRGLPRGGGRPRRRPARGRRRSTTGLPPGTPG